jgi:RHS repeat-associated protein
MTTDENGTYKSSYTYGLDRISVNTLGITDDKYTPLYYNYNGRGDVTSLVNTADQTEAKYRYDAFGVPKPGIKLDTHENGFINSYGYNGEAYDMQAGLQYLRARYYEPGTGRFLTRDSYLGNVMNPSTLNRYDYTGNNSVMNIDPSGHRIISSSDGSETAEERHWSFAAGNVARMESEGATIPQLQIGNSGDEVMHLQQRLMNLGYDVSGGADGQFGPGTQKALEQFQQDQGIAVDGVAGRQTETALLVARAIASDKERERIQDDKLKSQKSSTSITNTISEIQTGSAKNGCDGKIYIPGTGNPVSSNVILSSSLPNTGEPNSKGILYNPDGSIKQEREYGPDGQPTKDTDYNHGGVGHVFPHEHDWKDGVRQDGIPVTKSDSLVVKNVAKTGVAIGTGYLIYRGIRMLPSFFPPLWWTIPENVAIP